MRHFGVTRNVSVFQGELLDDGADEDGAESDEEGLSFPETTRLTGADLKSRSSRSFTRVVQGVLGAGLGLEVASNVATAAKWIVEVRP
jgi:hypothetical protein